MAARVRRLRSGRSRSATFQYRSIGPGGFIRQGPATAGADPARAAAPSVPAKPSPEIADKTSLLDSTTASAAGRWATRASPTSISAASRRTPAFLIASSIAAAPIRRSCPAASAGPRRRCPSVARASANSRGKLVPNSAALARWWRAPFSAACAGHGRQAFPDHPILGSRRLNRAGPHACRRMFSSPSLVAPPRLRSRVAADGANSSTATALSRSPISSARADFAGCAITLLVTPVRIRARTNRATRSPGACCSIPYYVSRVPEIRAFMHVPPLARPARSSRASMRTASLYPVHRCRRRRRTARPAARAPCRHLPPAMKAWLFLTTLRETDGPLTYVAGSHRLTAERLAEQPQQRVRRRQPTV